MYNLKFIVILLVINFYPTYGYNNFKGKNIYYIELTFKIDSSFICGRFLVKSHNKKDCRILDEIYNGKESFKHKDSFLNLINRSTIFFPLMHAEISNLVNKDSISYLTYFNKELLKLSGSKIFYSQICHPSFLNLRNKETDIISNDNRVLIKIYKLNIKGAKYTIDSLGLVRNLKSVLPFNYSWRFQYKDSKVIFSLDTSRFKTDTVMEKVEVYVPSNLINEKKIDFIFVTDCVIQEKRKKAGSVR